MNPATRHGPAGTTRPLPPRRDIPHGTIVPRRATPEPPVRTPAPRSRARPCAPARPACPRRRQRTWPGSPGRRRLYGAPALFARSRPASHGGSAPARPAPRPSCARKMNNPPPRRRLLHPSRPATPPPGPPSSWPCNTSKSRKSAVPPGKARHQRHHPRAPPPAPPRNPPGAASGSAPHETHAPQRSASLPPPERQGARHPPACALRRRPPARAITRRHPPAA